MPADSTQPELGYGGKFGFRGAGRNGVRSRGNASENVNPNCGLGSQRNPRLGCTGANNGRPLFPLTSSRHHAGTTFGTDITNIAGCSSRADKFKPLKPLPQPQQVDPPVAASVVVEVASTEQQLAAQIEVINVQDADEYAIAINNKLFQDEAAFGPRADYMETQVDLTPKMRMILMDWLIEVHMKYKLRSETLHLTVNLIDRYLTRVPVTRKRLQLIGVVAMFVASKFEEINPPELHDWVYITDKAYTKEEVLVMEVSMLTTLSFQIAVPTAAHFFSFLQKANGCSSIHRELAQYLIDLGLLEIRMLQYTPSHMVSAALLLSNELLARSPAWPQHMVHQSRHTETSLRTCVEIMRQLFDMDRAAEMGQLQAVHKKFSMKERHSVATMRL